MLRKHCIKNGLYATPYLNVVLYLHHEGTGVIHVVLPILKIQNRPSWKTFSGYETIENLDEYIGLKCLWLDHNAIAKIDNLDHLQELKCLYLHHNRIKRIENLTSLQNLDTINLSNNIISKLELLGTLMQLTHPMLRVTECIENFGLFVVCRFTAEFKIVVHNSQSN